MWKNKPSVAIIILNWNSYNDTFECLESLKQLNYKNFHVYLVDNDSKDNSFLDLCRDIKLNKFSFEITPIQTGANLGFAGGNNVAIKQAYKHGFSYVWLLNNDTTVNPNALNELVTVIDSDPSIGIVGSKIYYFGTNTIWFAGGKVNHWTGRTKHIGIKEEDTGKYSEVTEVEYITGCSMLFRTEIIIIEGCMREEYFLYNEETDWNIRLRQAGWKVLFVPNSVVFHKVSSSTGGDLSPSYLYYHIRNSFFMILFTQKSILKIITAFLYMLYMMFKNFIKVIINGDQIINKTKHIFLGGFHGVIKRVNKL